jgi:hypothetical protein
VKNPALTADLGAPLYMRRPELFNGVARVQKAVARARERFGFPRLTCRQRARLRARSIRHDVPRGSAGS